MSWPGFTCNATFLPASRGELHEAGNEFCLMEIGLIGRPVGKPLSCPETASPGRHYEFIMTAEANARLNDMLVELHRSLVQYILEAWPWTGNEQSELKAAILGLAERQQQDAGKIARLLMERHHSVNYGTYPDDFSYLNYVSLEYLSARLRDQQQQLIDHLQGSLSRLDADPAGRELIAEIVRSQKKGLDSLWRADLPE